MSQILLADSHYESPGVSDFWQPLIGHGPFALTRPMVVMVLTTIALVAVMVIASRKFSLVPSKGQAVLEALYDPVRNGLGRDIIGASQMRPYLPLLFALFTTLLVSNLLGVVPIIQFPTFGRIGFPIALMLFVYVTYHVVGIRKKGLGGYLRGLVPSGLPVAVVPLIAVLEFITVFITQPVTLALRLFGNMFAGHILLLLFATGGLYMFEHGSVGIKIVGVPTLLLYLVLTVFEALIEFLQAYIFTLLAATYISAALADEH